MSITLLNTSAHFLSDRKKFVENIKANDHPRNFIRLSGYIKLLPVILICDDIEYFSSKIVGIYISPVLKGAPIPITNCNAYQLNHLTGGCGLATQLWSFLQQTKLLVFYFTATDLLNDVVHMTRGPSQNFLQNSQ